MARPGTPAEPELIRAAFLLEEQPEHAGRRQPGGQRGGLLTCACLPQPAQQVGHAVRVVAGGDPGGQRPDVRAASCVDRRPTRAASAQAKRAILTGRVLHIGRYGVTPTLTA